MRKMGKNAYGKNGIIWDEVIPSGLGGCEKSFKNRPLGDDYVSQWFCFLSVPNMENHERVEIGKTAHLMLASK